MTTVLDLAAVRSETIKLSTVRAYKAIAALTVGVGGFAAFAVAHFVDDEPLSVASVFGFSTVFTAVFAAVAAILVFTTEAEHGTLAAAFAAHPRRHHVLSAKLVVSVVFAAALTLGGLGAGVVGSLLGGLEWGSGRDIVEIVGWSLGFAALAGLLGFGLGLIARHGAAAISGLLVWWLVVENLVAAFAEPEVVRFLPFVSGNGMLGFDANDGSLFFGPATSGLIFAGYAVAVLVAGLVTSSRSEP